MARLDPTSRTVAPLQSYIFGQGAFGNGGAPAVIWGWVVRSW